MIIAFVGTTTFVLGLLKVRTHYPNTWRHFFWMIWNNYDFNTPYSVFKRKWATRIALAAGIMVAAVSAILVLQLTD